VNSDLKSDGFTNIFSVLPDEMKEDIDAGFYLPGCIGDKVWNDLNQNGLQDEGEPGISGIEVILFRSNGQSVDTLVTDADGKYLFTGLTQGLYSLTIKFSELYKATLKDLGEDNIDSDIDSLGNTPLISLAHGAKFLDLDAGIFMGNSIDQFITPETSPTLQKSEVKISVLPNPALNEIELYADNYRGAVVIINANGKKMKETVVTDKIQRINISEFPADKYYVICKNDRGMTQTTFVKFD
jgi:hypothetical protein